MRARAEQRPPTNVIHCVGKRYLDAAASRCLARSTGRQNFAVFLDRPDPVGVGSERAAHPEHRAAIDRYVDDPAGLASTRVERQRAVDEHPTLAKRDDVDALARVQRQIVRGEHRAVQIRADPDVARGVGLRGGLQRELGQRDIAGGRNRSGDRLTTDHVVSCGQHDLAAGLARAGGGVEPDVARNEHRHRVVLGYRDEVDRLRGGRAAVEREALGRAGVDHALRIIGAGGDDDVEQPVVDRQVGRPSGNVRSRAVGGDRPRLDHPRRDQCDIAAVVPRADRAVVGHR